jgi:hypothetical protein
LSLQLQLATPPLVLLAGRGENLGKGIVNGGGVEDVVGSGDVVSSAEG